MISNSWRSGVTKAVILIYPILIFFIFFAKEVIFIVFGPNYAESTIYFIIAMIRDLSSPFLFYSILLATGRTDIYAKIHIVFAVLIWGLGFLICRVADIAVYYVVMSVSIALLIRVVGLVASSRSIKVPLIKMINISEILKIFVFAICCGILTKLAVNKIFDNQVSVFIVGGSIYAGLMILVDRLFHLKILETAISVIKKEDLNEEINTNKETEPEPLS